MNCLRELHVNFVREVKPCQLNHFTPVLLLTILTCNFVTISVQVKRLQYEKRLEELVEEI